VVRRVAALHRDADWRVWADLPDRDHRRPPTVAGARYDWIPAVYAEHGRIRRLVAVVGPDAAADRRCRAFVTEARDWSPHGSCVVVEATPTGAVGAVEHRVEPDVPPGVDPLPPGDRGPRTTPTAGGRRSP
jgi:hypothetical protein